MNCSDETVIRNLIKYEKEVICRMDIGKYDKMKECQEARHMDTRVKFIEGVYT